MSGIRVNHETVERVPTREGAFVVANPADTNVGACPDCDRIIDYYELVVLRGATKELIDGWYRIDLTDAEWVCADCVAKQLELK